MKSMNLTNPVDWTQAFRPPPRKLFLIFKKPELRPPVYEEMQGDMGIIINKVIAPYVSQSIVELHFEELVAECWHKTTKMNSEGLIDRCRTRSEFFAQYKTAIFNHICSLVQKHVYTEKRTGIKPPPKNQRNQPGSANTEQTTRSVEVRIDDPNSNVQLSELESGDDSAEYRQILEEVACRLTYLEQGVLNQLLSPNDASLFYAKLEAEIGREENEPLRVRIRQEHLARGLGISLEQFREIHESIKQKCLFMKNQKDAEDPRYAAAMATLVQFFQMQIPRSIDEKTCKRAILIAARHQFDRMKDNEGIKNAMRICDIPIPEVRNDRYRCYGVMFQKHHRTCNNCGVREGCELKASNFGLGEIALSPKLLGARHARVAVVSAGRPITECLTDEREEEILAFMDENFRRVAQGKLIHFRHKDRTAPTGANEQMIFTLENVSPLKLRFINPAEELKGSLKSEHTPKGGRRAWFLPQDLKMDEALNLIRTHAKTTFTKT